MRSVSTERTKLAGKGESVEVGDRAAVYCQIASVQVEGLEMVGGLIAIYVVPI